MELRVLNYFLTVAREGNFSRAAEKLHLSQPTLSRQIKDMEDAYGKVLLIREPRRIVLTDEGELLRRRAEEILSLVEKTEGELLSSEKSLSGDIHIGAGESRRFLPRHLLPGKRTRCFPRPPRCFGRLCKINSSHNALNSAALSPP